MEDVTVLPGSWRNFSGKEGQYNREGDRNFAVLLPPDVAKKMADDGWNVKLTKGNEEEGIDSEPYLSIAVSYKGRPPEIYVISSKGRVRLSEDEVNILDWANYDVADIIVTPYKWEVRDNSGIKAYLQKMFVTIKEDALDLKYAHIDEQNQKPGADGPHFQ
jgi:hypothetical protein